MCENERDIVIILHHINVKSRSLVTCFILINSIMHFPRWQHVSVTGTSDSLLIDSYMTNKTHCQWETTSVKPNFLISWNQRCSKKMFRCSMLLLTNVRRESIALKPSYRNTKCSCLRWPVAVVAGSKIYVEVWSVSFRVEVYLSHWMSSRKRQGVQI